MNNKHFSTVAYRIIVFLLLIFSTISLSATEASNEKTLPVTPSWASSDSIGVLFYNPKCTVNKERTSGAFRTSYDPHSQLIPNTELEAGRVTLSVDAYFGQSLDLHIENQLGEEMAAINMDQVDKSFLQVDLAAWDCGIYNILLVDQEGYILEYCFVID